MPIYAYKCASCGHAQDVLQKISDAPLTVCPQCGAPAFNKQVTAAGFQLKGTGWYVTDFRGGGASSPAASDGKGLAKPDQAKDGAAKPESKAEAKNASASGGAAPAASASPASSGGSSGN